MSCDLLVPLDEIGVEPGGRVAMGLHYGDNHERGPSFWWPSGVDVFTSDSYDTLITSKKSR